MAEEYEKLLDEAYKEIKPIKSSSQRFEIPKVQGRVEGNKTIITNFMQICSYIRRDCLHVGKFLMRELAAPGKIEGEILILVRKLPSQRINEKIEAYVKEFVFCKECGKPDTELLKEHRLMFLHCLACGAKHSVRAKIQ